MSTFEPYYNPEAFKSIWNAITGGGTGNVTQLFRDNPRWINVCYTDILGYQRTLLHEAVCYDNLAVARLVVEHGLDVDVMPVIDRDHRVVAGIVGKDRGITPFHFATWHNAKPETLRFLVESGANINAKGDLGWTPLHFALMDYPDKKIAAYLISAGADIYAKDDNGTTPVDLIRGKHWDDLIQS